MSMNRLILSVVVGTLLSTLGVSSTALAATSYKLCFRANAAYIDNAIPDAGENHVPVWTSDSTPRPLNGAAALVEWFPSSSCSGSGSSFPFFSYLDADGCTTTFSVASSGGCFKNTIVPSGIPVGGGGNYLYVLDSAGDNLKAESTYVPTSGGAKNIDFPDWQRWRVYAALAKVMTQINASLTNETFKVFLSDSAAACGCSGSGDRECTIDGEAHICLTPDGRSRLFLMAHEYGHGLLALSGGHPGNDCTFTSGGLPAGSWHGMNSIEFQNCAMSEGFADFVAVDAWNGEVGMTNPDAYIGYWGTGICGATTIEGGATEVIGAETGTGTCVVKYHESVLDTTGPWPGLAGEMDWMRTYWDFHTNNLSGSTGTPPGHGALLDYFANSSFSSDPTDSYEELRQGTADSGGCVQYERLVDLATANGVAHCGGQTSSSNGCANVVGCADVD